MLRHQNGSWVVPLGSFAAAVLLAIVAGPSSRAAAARAPGHKTMGCGHTAKLKESPFLCAGQMTGPGGALVPVVCDSEDFAPDVAGLSEEVLFFRQIHGQDSLAGRTLRVLRSARDGGRLHGVEEESETLDFTVTNKNETACDPCHDLTAFVLARAAVNINLTRPVLPGDSCDGSALAKIKAHREADCAQLSPADVTETFRASFFRQVTPAGEFEQGWQQDVNGTITDADGPLGAGDPDIGVVVHTVALPQSGGFEAHALNFKAKMKYKAHVQAYTTRSAQGPDKTARSRSTVQLLVGDLTCETEGVGNLVKALDK